MESSKKMRYAIYAGVWLAALGLLIWVFSSNAPQPGDTAGLKFQAHFYLALISLSFKTVFVGVMIFYILPLFSQKRRLAFFIIQSIACLLICFVVEQYIQFYIAELVWPGFLQPGHLFLTNNPFGILNLVIYIVLFLAICFYYFAREWVKNEKLKREMIEMQLTTELKFLKNQINPHFLFNTLNNLFSISQRNNDTETANGISKLAGLLRYILYESSVINVPLEKELNNIRNFVALSKLRYPNEEVTVKIETTGDLDRAEIAPMILLPFVENAFKHGIDVETVNNIFISVAAEENSVVFKCINAVVKANVISDDAHGGIGLENVKRRLSLLYPERHSLILTRTADTYTAELQLNR